eukprot:Gb_04305 [translate_table: standard]
MLSMDISSSATQRGGSSSLSNIVVFRRSSIIDSSISSKLQLVGRVIGDSSGGLLGSDPRGLFVNFFIELVLMSKTKGSPLARLVAQEPAKYGSGRCLEMTLRWILVEFHASPFGLKLTGSSVMIEIVCLPYIRSGDAPDGIASS